MAVNKSFQSEFEIKKEFYQQIPAKKFRPGLFLVFVIGMLTLFSWDNATGQGKNLVVRLAKLRIDSAQLENYKAALKEEIETSVRLEPGVLNLYAVAEKDNPSAITIFEIYADDKAYKSHLETPHFKKYKSVTKGMVKSLELIETLPIALGSKTK